MTDETPKPGLEMLASRLLTAWLDQAKISLAFTTYQAGKLFLIGLQEDGRLSVFERTFSRSMGLGVDRADPGVFHMSSLYQLWRFQNFLDPGQMHQGYDAVYVPVLGHTSGDIDVHDIHSRGGAPVFVATRFNCLATLDNRYSFRPVWKPPFIDRIAAEDRCHLNGMAMEPKGDAALPTYVTCVSRTNVADGWREHRRQGGMVLDVATGEPVATDLSMPHSPRLHDGKLWLLQSGTGEFGQVDPKSGTFTPVCFLQGFARGMAFAGDHAVIGVSKPREGTFEGLALNDRLAAEGVSAKCALMVVNLKTGDIEHSLDFSGLVEELYDIAVLPGVRRPMALGFKTNEIRFMVRPGELP
ncbi:MAG: TIGR03032 family protein [Pseudomonadota bacterium]